MSNTSAPGRRILALDLATKTGWAVSNGPSGVWNLKPRIGDSRGMLFLNLISRLNDTLHAFLDLDIIAFEQQVSHRNTANAVQFGLQAHVQSWVDQENLRRGASIPHIEYVSVNIAHIKQHALGKGGGKGTDKAAMMAAARAKGWSFEDDNHADALWLLDYVQKKLLGGTV